MRQGVRSDKSPPVAGRRRTLRDPTLCERCGAVYSGKTWRTGAFAVAVDPVGASWAVCPACEQLETGEYFGRVVIRGFFAAAHRDAIRRRILNVEARARFTQPQRRIVALDGRGRVFDVFTTSQKLAHRIARELTKTFGGRTTLAWSDRDGELYATWMREGPPAPPAPPRRRRIRGRRRWGATDLEIQTRGTELDPSWRDLIEGAVARLVRRHPALMRMHVTLRHGRHHRTGLEHAAVLATLPRATLRAAKQAERMPDALRAMFDALEAELERRGNRRSRASSSIRGGRRWRGCDRVRI